MDIVEYINHYAFQPLINESRKPGSFHPSSASALIKNPWDELEPVGKCLRAQYYSMKGIGPDAPTDASGMRKMNYGTLIHKYETERLRNLPVRVQGDIRFYDSVRNISGEVDVIMEDPRSKAEPKPLIGIEYKTISGYPAKKLINPKTLMKERPEHVLQILVYAEFFKHPVNGYLTWFLIYVDRGTGETFSHTIIPTENGVSVNGELYSVTVKDVYKRWDTLKYHVESDVLPERDYDIKYSQEKLDKMAERQLLSKTDVEMIRKGRYPDKSDWQCNFCSHKLKCWSTT